MKTLLPLEWLFPKRCVGCKGEGNWLCLICFESIEPKYTSACADCQRLTGDGRFCRLHKSDHALTGLLSIGDFSSGVLREAIHVLKYNGVRELATPLSFLLAKRLSIVSKLSNAMVLPVPLHAKREAERGFNQSVELVKSFREVDTDVLVRYRATPPQATLDHVKRKTNLAEAFGIRQEAIARIKGKKIVIVDDVSTTGATLDTIAELLKRYGARQVWGLVLAKG